MTVKIEEFVAHLGWEVDPGKLDEFNSQVGGIVDTFKKVAIAIAGAATALIAFAIITNKQTSINARLAESIDISAESLENWAFFLGAIDFNAEKVIRTVKTLNDRIGQAASGIGDAATVKDAVAALGLEFDELKKKDPEGQFRAILQGAKSLEDGQIAAAAATQLLGRQGAFLAGFIRDQKGSVDDLLIEQAKFNLLTEENRESAKEFIGLWDNTTAVIDSSKAAFAAFLTDALSPILKELLEWVKANRELIKLKIAEWAERAGKFLEIVFEIVKRLILAVDRVADAFGGLQNVLALLAGLGTGLLLAKIVRAFQTLVPLIWAAVKAQGALNLLMKGAKIAGFVALLVLAGLAINSLVRFFQGKDSLVGDIGEAIAEQMDIGLQALADFFGFSKDEFNVWLVGVIGSIEDGFSDAFDAIFNFWTEVFELDTWDKTLDAWQSALSVFSNWTQRTLISLVNWIAGFIPDRITKVFRGALASALSIVRQIPIIGDALAPSAAGLAGSTNVGTPAARQTPSASALGAITNNRNIQSIVNRTSQGGSPIINIDMPVTQQAGEDGPEFRRRVVSVLETEVATAIRDNDTGRTG